MSKLGAVIQASSTRERVALYDPVPATYAAAGRFDPVSHVGVVYEIGTKFNVRVVIPEYGGTRYLNIAIEDARKQMLHEVFGEYRDALFRAMRYATKNGSADGYKAAEILRSVLENMGSNEPYEYREPRG